MHNVPEEALYEENIRSNRSIKVIFSYALLEMLTP